MDETDVQLAMKKGNFVFILASHSCDKVFANFMASCS